MLMSHRKLKGSYKVSGKCREWREYLSQVLTKAMSAVVNTVIQNYTLSMKG